MRPIQVCLSISKELRDSYPGLDDQIFREAAEMLGRKLLEDGILERHLEPDINRPEFHYILTLNRKDLSEPKSELRESEDERIRKELWEYFHNLQLSSDCDFSPSFTIDDVLAYLEKLKEQNPNIEICPHSIKSKSYLETGYPSEEKPVEGLDKARFLEVLDKWEAHAIRGMRDGATAYHQGKIALITDLRDWINREG